MNHVLKNIHHEYDLKHILHPFAEFPRFLNEGSRVFDKAEGAYVHDVDGKKYLDGIGGLWCVNIGYGRQEMADAIAEQVLTLPYYNTFTDMSSVPASALAATLFSDHISRAIIDDGVFAHGFTYSGHPVACAAGLKNIEIIEREDLCGHVRETGPYFEQSLANLKDLDIVGDVRGRCYMLAVEFVCDKATKQNFDTSVEIGRRVALEAYRRGLIARNVGDFIILSPPLTLTKEQIDFVADTLHASVLKVMDELKNAGG